MYAEPLYDSQIQPDRWLRLFHFGGCSYSLAVYAIDGDGLSLLQDMFGTPSDLSEWLRSVYPAATDAREALK